MPPKRRRRARRPSAKARAKAKAVGVKNERRTARRAACQSLNALAGELHVKGPVLLEAKSAQAADVEKIVRLLEKRVQCEADMTRLRSASKKFQDKGGLFSVPLLEKDEVSPPAEFVFTDRGRGFFEPNSGRITREYKEALAENDLRPFMGDCARIQPGSMQDLLLHETAVSWLRFRLGRTLPKKCWEESREDYGRRLKRCCEETNQECDVEALCHGLPKRMKKLQEAEGDRLQH